MVKTKTPPAPIKAAAAAAGYRAAIAKAEAEGIAKADMVLRLTRKNDADLKRDRSVDVHEISFLGGEMRFLGVKVVAGGVDVASLEFTPLEEQTA